jgi:hypothetical protein
MVHGVPKIQEINNIINTMRMRIGMLASSRMVIHTMISIAAFFLESGDNLSTGITYNTRMSKHKMTLKIYNPGDAEEARENGRWQENCWFCRRGRLWVWKTEAGGCWFYSPAWLELQCQQGGCFRGNWSSQYLERARRSRR